MNVIVSITTKKQLVPATQVPSGNVRFQLRQGTNVLSSIYGSLTTGVTFTSVADGSYTVAAQRMSMQNTAIGDESVSQPFSVVNMSEIDVPDTVSVSV